MNNQKALLGSIIIGYNHNKDYSIFEKVKDNLKEEYFSNKNRVIYNAILSLYGNKEPITNISVHSKCKDKIEAHDLSELFLVENEIPSYSFVEFYAEEIKKEYYDEKIKNAENKEDLEKIIDEMKSIKKNKIDYVVYDKALQEAFFENVEGKNESLSYGYRFLNDRLGGIQKGELVLLGGITGTGKSTLSSKIALNASKEGKKVVVVSLEERITQRARKEIFYYCNRIRKINGKKTLRLIDYLNNQVKFDEDEQLEAIKKLSNNIKYLKSDERISVNRIKEIFSEKADLYIFDHLHYFGIETKDESKANAIEQAMQEIKNLTVQNESRTILVAHFQKIDETKRPTMSNFKDSISIPQTSDTVIMLWRDKSNTSSSQYETEFICPKNRIDEPSFTAKALFDISTNDYVGEIDCTFGTQDSEYQSNQKFIL